MSELVRHLTRALDTGMIPVRRENGGQAIRLVALDLDGTLLTGEKRLNPATVQAVRQCVEQGVQVVLASARPPRAVRKVWQILGLDTLSIHYNGALIYDLAQGQPVFHQPLDAALARQVVAAARRAVADCFVHVEVLDRWYTDRYDPGAVPESGRASEPDFVGSVESFLTGAVTKLMFMTTPTKLVKIRGLLDRRFAGRFVMAISDDHLLQVMHLRADKAFALARVAERYGVGPEQIMAVGDAPNDCGMLRWAGLGVAMSNAWDEALEAADVVVSCNETDGVAQALRQYVLAPSAA